MSVRSAALLALVCPPRLLMTAFRAATYEAREILDVEPVEAGTDGRDAVEQHLRDLGSAGERAAAFLRRVERAREEPDAPSLGLGLSPGGPGAMETVRSLSVAEIEVVESEQGAAARELFAPNTVTRDRPRRTSATRLAAASLLDRDPLVQAAAAAATLRLDPKNPLADAILNEASRDRSDEVAELSRAILATDRESENRRIEVENPRTRKVNVDSALLHGTWARRGRWWRPGGDLHQYLSVEAGLFPELYSGGTPFEWSGYFSFRAWKGAKEDWIDSRPRTRWRGGPSANSWLPRI